MIDERKRKSRKGDCSRDCETKEKQNNCERKEKKIKIKKRKVTVEESEEEVLPISDYMKKVSKSCQNNEEVLNRIAQEKNKKCQKRRACSLKKECYTRK